MTDQTPPLDYHLVRVEGGLVYCVDAETVHEVWYWIQEWDSDDHQLVLDITTIDGGDITLIRHRVLSIEHTIPEIRHFNREHEAMMKRERIDQGFLDAD